MARPSVLRLSEEERALLDDRRRLGSDDGPPPGSFAYALAKCRPCRKCGGPRTYAEHALCERCDPKYSLLAHFIEEEEVMAKEKAMEKAAEKAVERVDSTRIKKIEPLMLTIIGLDTPHKAGEHALYDERIHLALSEAMVRNVMARGVEVPVVVRMDGDTLEVVEGRQRVRAAREANIRLGQMGERLLKVPYVVKEMDDNKALGTMISLNEIRRADAALTKARKAARMIDRGIDREEIARDFGVTVQSIDVWMKVLACDALVLEALEKGLLKMSAARELAALPREEQRSIVQELTKAPAEPRVRHEEDGEEEEDDAAERPASEVTGEITAADIKKEKRKRSKKDGEEEERDVYDAPSKVMINRLLRYSSNEEDDIFETVRQDEILTTVIRTIKWLNGLSSPRSIKGLMPILTTIEKRHAKKEE